MTTAEKVDVTSVPRTSLSALEQPWAFTQERPLGTSEFIREAKRRGLNLDLAGLRELYRTGILAPFIEIMSRQVGEPIEMLPDTVGYSSLVASLRHAARKGCVRDPGIAPYRRHTQFKRPRNASHYWENGLLYSRYQLLLLSDIEALWTRRRLVRNSGGSVVRMPKASASLDNRAHHLRNLSIVLSALEARYLPKIEPEWIRVRNSEIEDWEQYRKSFAPAEFADAFNYPPEHAQADAEQLLRRAEYIDPLGPDWGSLARRAPNRALDKLSGAALRAMDCREAAEILLLYYEDMASRGGAAPLPTIPPFEPDPLRERLSARRQSLDEDLQSLGLSPHPRVVLIIEGETEEELFPLARGLSGLSDAPELVRFLTLRGIKGDLTKVAALAATPLVGERHGDTWSLIKPPTILLIAVDPEESYSNPVGIANERGKIIKEVARVLAAQGVTVHPDDLEELVHVRTWDERCFEFAHFDNDELADAVIRLAPTINGLTREDLIKDIEKKRVGWLNIDKVWEKWKTQPSKRALGRELWPVLAAKIDDRRTDHSAPMPPIVDVLIEADHLARRWQYRSPVLRAASAP
ncbi:hypothetical protein ACIBSS_19755 [Micromonospora aurantiaca]|uniref:hypothetical protein n=1 Tax=Micromonospora aurantiaca (nom. illeg.) TaxID=47850 RepID=UPI00378B7039